MSPQSSKCSGRGLPLYDRQLDSVSFVRLNKQYVTWKSIEIYVS